jgi:hypothetical protein
MPTDFGLPREVLRAISRLSGDSYRDVEGEELIAELDAAGVELTDDMTLYNLMFRLRDDGGYLTFHGGAGMDAARMGNIRLAERGRQEVEGWPMTPGAVSGADVEALLAVLDQRSADPTTPAPEQGKARAAASALRELGVSVTGEVIAAWLKHVGVG